MGDGFTVGGPVRGGVVAQRWDVFVSYAHEDEAWVRVLAENLHRVGRDVFFDRWEVVGGSRLAQRLQEGLAASNVVVLVVSRAAVGKEWWREEFSAAMAGVVAGAQRLIPVLLDEVPLPPFVAGRVWVDFAILTLPRSTRRVSLRWGRCRPGRSRSPRWAA